MNEQIFRIRPYSKRELAGLYFPFTKNADTAVKNLNNLSSCQRPITSSRGRVSISPMMS